MICTSEFIQHLIHSVRYKLYTLNPCISVTFVLFADSISVDRCPARVSPADLILRHDDPIITLP